ncbi:MAG: M23 family metallopeptidase [Bacteroidia bacterium]|nr:M23 family metallopeptidase [Bacteroidia bacterium]
MLRNLYSRLRERLNRTYRVEFIDDVTLSSSRQFQLKPLTVVLWGTLLFIGIVVGTATFVILSPALHSMIPGYINPSYHQELQETYEYRLDSLENVKDKYETYLATFRHLAGVGGDNISLISQAELQEELRKAGTNSGTKDADGELSSLPDNSGAPDEGSSLVNNLSTDSKPITEKVSIPAVRTVRRPVLLQLFPPVKGKIRKPFNEKSRHYGTDIVAEENTPIRSLADGFVIISEYSDKNGWVIGVLSEDNIIAFYKHNSRLLKRAGEYVLAGEPLAIIGNTGENSTGPHLHLELWQNGKPLDPLYYINFN